VLDERVFAEANGNKVLDADEMGELTLQVRNDGLGAGKVSVRLTPLSLATDLRFKRYTDVGIIPVQGMLSIKIPIEATAQVEDGLREIRVEIVEEYSRSTLPFTVAFQTSRRVKPELRVIVREYDDGRFFSGNTPDGLIQAGEMIKVVANVQNLGGEAAAVLVEVKTDAKEDIRYTRDLQGNWDSHFALGRLATGENRDLVFYFFTTPVFTDPKVHIQLEISTAQRLFVAAEKLTFDIGQSVETADVLAVEAVRQQQTAFDLIQAETIDIEQIPQKSKTRLEHGLAVIFGIERYKHTFDANYKTRDATTFFQYCRDVLGIPEGRILLRVDSDATKAEFDYVFEAKDTPNQGWLKKRLRDPSIAAQTDLIVYLAGHGFPDLASGHPYLIPHDVRPEQTTNGVALQELYQILGSYGARSVTVFVESCFSGASGYDRSGSEKLLALNMNPVFPMIEKPMVGPRMAVFTATSGQTASSNRDDLKHGIFTYFVLKGIGGAADGNGDKGITIGELFRYLEREVPRKALEPPLDREQVPSLFPSLERLGDGAEHVLVQY
jgi:outer membrane protein assembly factor BamE (lipoprotein component of BamABCDE complex)